MSASQSNLKAICPAKFTDILARCGLDAVVVGQLTDTQRIRNLEELLTGMGAQVAVIEDEYFDRDYIEDYARYYARCHKSYGRHCVRVHMFDKKFLLDDVRQLILSEGEESARKLQAHYLGFVVIRPLQKTVIGRTCLRVPDGSSIKLLAKRHVSVSFFGCPLNVECLPFQEQDKAVSACATSALWSAFQVTSCLFGHCNFSPSRITEFATDLGISFGRVMPNNHGLTIEEMLHAVRRVGLDVVCVRLSDPNMPLRKSIMLGNLYAYLHAGLPIVLVGKLLPDSAITQSECVMHDMHAITVCGYCKPEDGATGVVQCPQLLAASIVDIVANDDQIGVYEKLRVKRSFAGTDFETRWVKNQNELGFNVRYLIVPVYHKIRVSYEDIWDALVVFDRMVRTYVRSVRIRWSIVLSRSNDFKQRVRAMTDISDEAKLGILTSCLPRYIWEVSAFFNNEENVVFCIDATDAGQGLEVGRSLFKGVDLVDIVGAMPFKDPIKDNPLFNACFEAVKIRESHENQLV